MTLMPEQRSFDRSAREKPCDAQTMIKSAMALFSCSVFLLLRRNPTKIVIYRFTSLHVHSHVAEL